MPANHVSATFSLISCPKRNFDGSRARYRRNHGEIAVCGNKIGEIVAELVNREKGIDEIVAVGIHENYIDGIKAAAADRCVQGFCLLTRGWQVRVVGTTRCQQPGLVRVREYEGEVRHRSRTYVRQLKASEGRILWGVLPSLAFCPVRGALSQSASAASLGLGREEEVREK